MSRAAAVAFVGTLFVASLPNAGAHHEFKGFQTHVPFA